MNRHVLTTVLTLFCISIFVFTPAMGDEEDGFVPLFDGKSFTGWRVSEDTSTSGKIENECLVLTGGRIHLFRKETFDDFVVRFESASRKEGLQQRVLRSRPSDSVGEVGPGSCSVQMRQKPCPNCIRHRGSGIRGKSPAPGRTSCSP